MGGKELSTWSYGLAGRDAFFFSRLSHELGEIADQKHDADAWVPCSPRNGGRQLSAPTAAAGSKKKSQKRLFVEEEVAQDRGGRGGRGGGNQGADPLILAVEWNRIEANWSNKHGHQDVKKVCHMTGYTLK